MTEDEIKQFNVQTATLITENLFKSNKKILQISIDAFIEKNNQLIPQPAYELPNKSLNFVLSSDKRTPNMQSTGVVHESLLQEHAELIDSQIEALKQVSFIVQCFLAVAIASSSIQEFRNSLPETVFSVLPQTHELFKKTSGEEEKIYLTREEKTFVFIRKYEEIIPMYIGQSLLNI